MSDLPWYPEDSQSFDAVLDRIGRVLNTSCRLPESPFRSSAANADVCQYGHAIGGAFGDVLQALVDVHGDDTISLVVLEPSPQYYRDSYGCYPSFTLPGRDLSAAFWDSVAHEPEGDPTGAVTYTANVFAVAGSSNAWAVWAERSWDIAIVMSEHSHGPWLSRSVPFVAIDTALADFTEPDFKIPLSSDQRTMFLRNFRQRTASD